MIIYAGGLLIILLGVLCYRITIFWQFNVFLALLLLIYFFFISLSQRKKFDFIGFSLFIILIGFLHSSQFTAYNNF